MRYPTTLPGSRVTLSLVSLFHLFCLLRFNQARVRGSVVAVQFTTLENLYFFFNAVSVLSARTNLAFFSVPPAALSGTR